MILVCYDGSSDAKAAIERGGELLEAQSATVLTVWEPFGALAAGTPVGFAIAPSIPETEPIDRASAESARELAEQGAQLTRNAGLEAEPRICSQERTISETILAEAEAVGASGILMGSRGLTGVKSLLLGSVSHAVVQHADRPVIVVPSPEVAATRTRTRSVIHESE